MSLVEHLEKLRHFHKVTTYRSINEAAKGTGMSQAGLSKCIANLESILAVTLFLRNPDGLVLTKEGEALLKATTKILSEANEAEATLKSLRASRIPTGIVIGMYDSIAVYFFPELKKYLKAVYPSIEVHLVVDRSENILRKLKTGELDLAIGVNLKFPAKGFHSYLLFEDFYSFYLPPSVSSQENLPIIFHPSASDDQDRDCESYLRSTLNSRASYRVYNFETVKSLTLSELGIGVLPTQVANPLVQKGLLKAVSITKIPRLFGKHNIVFLAGDHFFEKHQDFVDDIYRLGERWAKT